jgi:hypothetical protein
MYVRKVAAPQIGKCVAFKRDKEQRCDLCFQVILDLEGEGRRQIPGGMKPSTEAAVQPSISGSPQEIGDY